MDPRSVFSVAQRKPDAALRLLCFPHAGGGPTAFFPWIALLAPEIECVSIQYPGRGQRFREGSLTGISYLVGEIAAHVAEIVDRPFALYGHSLGGLVAFELARLLRRLGSPAPEHLFVGASRPPHLGPVLPTIHELPDSEFVDVLQTRYGGIPTAIYQDRELLNLFMVPMRADFTAYELYRLLPEAPIGVPITAFAATEDQAATPSTMQEWARHTAAQFDLKILPGGHFFPPDSVARVVQTIRGRLLGRRPAPPKGAGVESISVCR
ncbi:MAG: alpha/beta fold hydrolase [Acidobacteriaceae bacterium]